MFKYTYITKWKHKLTIIKYNIPNCFYSNSKILAKNTEPSLECLFKYSKEESDQILNTINQKSNDELLRYISINRLKNLQMWKQEHGEFNSIEQILEVNNFGYNILQRFCNDVLNKNTKKTIKPKSIAHLTVPNFSDCLRYQIKSCVSVHIGISNISWSCFNINENRQINLINWGCLELEDKNFHLFDLIESVLHLDKLIPPGDIYILETPLVAQGGSAPGSVKQININQQKSQLTSMISFMLSHRNAEVMLSNRNKKSEKLSHFYFMKRLIAARLFGTVIGTEKISTESITRELLDIYETSGNESPQIKTDFKVKQTYENSTNVDKEIIGQSFLLGLAFIKLVILQCPDSLKKINKRN